MDPQESEEQREGEEEELDEFEDNEEAVGEKYSDKLELLEGDKSLEKRFMVVDCEEFRRELPAMRIPVLKISMLFGMFKNLIGKDLSKFSLPVFINEPFTVLQKAGELLCLSH
mmetsp:Transcript_17862/g.30326  ORF Transcript_17862/g.30326 Transcript_17862/m.30326 type:complete len:113 (+) Transcript_17862:1599-1937(+)